MPHSEFGLHDFRDGERVISIVRHHWWVLFREIIGIAFLFILPFFLLPMVFAMSAQTGAPPPVSPGVIIFFGSLWALILWHLLFARWTDYYFDLWVITNWRIIDIDQKGFFHRNIATLMTLDHIQDIETNVVGVIGNILEFGNIQVQTAAAHRVFLIEEVPNPRGVERLIRSAQEERLRVFGAGGRGHP